MTTPARLNPFATDRLQRELPFDPAWCGTDWENLLNRLTAQRHRGLICGPHGSGKTTLLDALAPRLEHRGFRPLRWLLTDELPAPRPDDWQALAASGADTILLLDGAERLPWRAWHRLLTRHEPHLGGLVATTHRPTRRLPLLLKTQTTPAMLIAFIRRLDPGFLLGDDAIAELHETHRGNLREALFACYDQASADPPSNLDSQRPTPIIPC